MVDLLFGRIHVSRIRVGTWERGLECRLIRGSEISGRNVEKQASGVRHRYGGIISRGRVLEVYRIGRLEATVHGCVHKCLGFAHKRRHFVANGVMLL